MQSHSRAPLSGAQTSNSNAAHAVQRRGTIPDTMVGTRHAPQQRRGHVHLRNSSVYVGNLFAATTQARRPCRLQELQHRMHRHSQLMLLDRHQSTARQNKPNGVAQIHASSRDVRPMAPRSPTTSPPKATPITSVDPEKGKQIRYLLGANHDLTREVATKFCSHRSRK